MAVKGRCESECEKERERKRDSQSTEEHIDTRRRSYLFQLTSYISFPSTKSLLPYPSLRRILRLSTVWNAEIESKLTTLSEMEDATK